jgi:hypothetical protein
MCHSLHHGRGADSRGAVAPSRREPGLRASDDEREATVTQLRGHATAGRIDVEELEQRVGAAYAARTHGELAALLEDLPGRPAARSSAAQPRRGHEWSGFLQVNMLLVAIWALGGGGYFWPAWVIAWWGVALLMRSGPRLLRLGQ